MDSPAATAASLKPSDDEATDCQFLVPDPESTHVHAPPEYEAVYMEPLPETAAANLVPSDDNATDCQPLEPDPESTHVHTPPEYEAV